MFAAEENHIMKFYSTIFPLFTAVMLLGCARQEPSEGDAEISCDTGSIEVPAEFPADRPDSIKTLKISSNRSWFAHLNDKNHPVDPSNNEKVDWGFLDFEDYVNVSNSTADTDITVTFARNRSTESIEGSLDIYMAGRLALSIPIHQAGAVYYLDAEAGRTVAECTADTLAIEISCNTNWSARIDDGATADVKLSQEGGIDDSCLNVIFGNNYDASNDKTATVVISAENCQDKIISFTQKKAQPFLQLEDGIITKLVPGVYSGSISFRTNCPWSIAVKQGAKMTDIEFSKSSGAPESGKIDVGFTFKNPGDDPHIVNDFTAVLSVDGDVVAPIEIPFSQRSAFVLDFDTYPDAPYGLETTKGLKYSISVETSLGNTYICNIDNCNYRNKSDSYGLQIPQYGYFGLPGISGMKMTKIICYFKYHSSFKKLRLYPCSPADVGVYYAGVLANYAITENWVHTFVAGQVTDPETKGGNGPVVIPAGEGCTMYCGSNTNNLVGRFEVIYEPVE